MLDAVDAKDFDALKRLAATARAEPSAWPIEACDALLQRLRDRLEKGSNPPKREFVEDFARHVGERRRAARGGTP